MYQVTAEFGNTFTHKLPHKLLHSSNRQKVVLEKNKKKEKESRSNEENMEETTVKTRRKVKYSSSKDAEKREVELCGESTITQINMAAVNKKGGKSLSLSLLACVRKLTLHIFLVIQGLHKEKL